jgi:hypothetical protein
MGQFRTPSLHLCQPSQNKKIPFQQRRTSLQFLGTERKNKRSLSKGRCVGYPTKERGIRVAPR